MARAKRLRQRALREGDEVILSWSRRPPWLADAVWLAVCIGCSVHYWHTNQFAWFGLATFACGLLVSGLAFGWILRGVEKQRDELSELLKHALATARESHGALLIVLPVLEEAAEIIATRPGYAAREKSN